MTRRLVFLADSFVGQDERARCNGDLLTTASS